MTNGKDNYRGSISSKLCLFSGYAGTVGTLYGLLIGLDVSGVKELGDKAQTVDKINDSLDQLLGGTATALLSSLLGLVGAFLALRPLTWLYQWATN